MVPFVSGGACGHGGAGARGGPARVFWVLIPLLCSATNRVGSRRVSTAGAQGRARNLDLFGKKAMVFVRPYRSKVMATTGDNGPGGSSITRMTAPTNGTSSTIEKVSKIGATGTQGGGKKQKKNPVSRFFQFLLSALGLNSAAGIRRNIRLMIAFACLSYIISKFDFTSHGPVLKAAAPPIQEVPYSVFLEKANPSKVLGMFGGASEISDVKFSSRRIDFKVGEESFYTLPIIGADQGLLTTLMGQGVQFYAQQTSALAAAVSTLLPILIFTIVWALLLSRMLGGGGENSVGKLAQNPSIPEGGFDKVAGIDEAKLQLVEIVDFLKNPFRYMRIGARLPKGVLMVGEPGTGKTLLARAMAAEAGVPFFYCSGSEFVEMFVGRGASRLRNLFKRAVQASPCVIFIDELDALGKKRDSIFGGAASEVDQTLNQLLVCMDGLDTSKNGVIVLGATNRPEVLDPALCRPGRFDRIVKIERPDIDGREAILKVHTKPMKLDKDVSLLTIAAETPGLTGAELEALCNEAAIRSVRRARRDPDAKITQADFDVALRDFFKSRSVLTVNPVAKFGSAITNAFLGGANTGDVKAVG